jgi:hypothetical protein
MPLVFSVIFKASFVFFLLPERFANLSGDLGKQRLSSSLLSFAKKEAKTHVSLLGRLFR